MRTFKSPNGREWTAELLQLPSDVGIQTAKGPVRAAALLRFSSGDLTLDLADFPADWKALSDAELVKLLRMATSPNFTTGPVHRIEASEPHQ